MKLVFIGPENKERHFFKYVTVDNVYDVVDEYSFDGIVPQYLIKNDAGNVIWLPGDQFVPLNNKRESVIDSLLS
jgi:hypothetical protein